MAKMKDSEVARIAEWQKATQFYGTPEKGYTDSGLWSFLPYVYTKDSHDSDDPVKPLMDDAPEYLFVVFLYMLACPVLAVPKSRQMRLSWATTAFSVWHTMTAPYRHTIYQTKKEDDAFAMVSQGSKNPAAGRMDFIIQHLPGWLRDGHVVSGRGNSVGCLTLSPKEYDEHGFRIPWYGSAINAIPQGAHQVRQYTPSLLVSDESAFQEEFEASMIAARPAVAGGGKVLCVSSVDSGSAFNQMVLESPTGDMHEHCVQPDVQTALDMMGMAWPRGLKSWQTPSGVWCLEVHYTADPAKDPARDGAYWVSEAVKGYVGGFESSGWKTEMEIDYSAGGGDPVFSFITGLQHPIFCEPVGEDRAINTMNIYAGYDYGARNNSSFQVWGFDKTGHPWSLWELVEPCTNIADHVAKMKRCPYWEHIQYIVCDPSIMAKTQQTATGTKSIAEIFADHGVTFVKGRRGADVPMAIRFLSEYWADPKNPGAHICAKTNPNLAQTVMNLRWEKHLSAGVAMRHNNPERIRDKDNHDWDATAYLFDTRPSNWIAPTVKRTGICFQDLLESLTEKHRNRTSPDRGGIRVA
jgi:hypothetical protein